MQLVVGGGTDAGGAALRARDLDQTPRSPSATQDWVRHHRSTLTIGAPV